MDPLTQGALGAVASQSAGPGAHAGRLAIVGALAGMAADLDILIRSRADPLLFLEYHRQFTHALAFVPVGALLVSLALWKVPGIGLPFRSLYLAACLGYGTHGLLDACTSYGTQLLWPLANTRVAWDLISVVDPLFSLPILALAIIAWRRGQSGPARAALLWGLFYLAIGAVQGQRADQLAESIADARGHERADVLIKPAFGNLLLWKSVYRSGDRLYVDGIRAGTALSHCGGTSIAALPPGQDPPLVRPGSQQQRDLARFRWFSGGYLALWPEGSRSGNAQIIDVRYANLPNAIDPLWGIELQADTGADSHVRWWANRRATPEQRRDLWLLLTQPDCRQE
jgi:inner membrane protein